MKLVGAGGQVARHPLYDASGVITTGGTAQLVLAQSQSRSHLALQNLSNGDLWFEVGSARAVATITNGVVTSVAVTNAGMGFTKPPVIEFLGGGKSGNTTYLGLNQPGGAAPDNANGTGGRPAKAHCVLTTGAVSSIVIDDGGAGYAIAPYCYIYNSDLDPYGVAIPSSSSGFLLKSGAGPIAWNGSVCPTEAISIIGATTNQAFLAKWME